MSETPGPLQQFCQHAEGLKRCVLGANHGGVHELHPYSSASVRAITRQEADDARMGGTTPGRVVEAIDRAAERASEEAEKSSTAAVEKPKPEETPPS